MGVCNTTIIDEADVALNFTRQKDATLRAAAAGLATDEVHREEAEDSD